MPCFFRCAARALSFALASAALSSACTVPTKPNAVPPSDGAVPARAGAQHGAVAGSPAATPDARAPSAPTRDAAPALRDAADDLDAGPQPMTARDAGLADASASCKADFCESFEATGASTLDTQRWEIVTPNCMGTGQIDIDATQAHWGSRSLRVQGEAGYCNHVFVRPRAAAWKPSDPLYVRYFLRIAAPLGASHVTLVALRDEHEMKDLRLGGQSEILMWNRESDDATLPELSPTGIGMSARPAAMTWQCVEFMVDAKSPTLLTWLNGQPVAGLRVEGSPTADVDAQWQRKTDWRPQLSDLRIGWESYGNDANTLWFDDLAAATSRIGCEP